MDLAEFKSWLAKCPVSMRQVLGLRNELDSIVVGGGGVPTSRTVNGHALSSDVTVSKSDVGLGNCDDTSDANKPISTATQSALDDKQDTLIFTPEDVANKSTDTALGISDTLYPSQNAVKSYVDANSGGGTSVPIAAWYRLLDSNVAGDYQNYSFRILLPSFLGVNSGGYLADGNQVRVGLVPYSTAGTNSVIDNVSIGLWSSGNDCSGSMTELLFGGNHGCTLTGGGAIVFSDWTAFTLTSPNICMVACDIGGGTTYKHRYGSWALGITYYKAATNSYNVAAPGTSGWSNAAEVDLVGMLQVKTV